MTVADMSWIPWPYAIRFDVLTSISNIELSDEQDQSPDSSETTNPIGYKIDTNLLVIAHNESIEFSRRDK